MTDDRILEILQEHCIQPNCGADERAIVVAIRAILSEAANSQPQT